MPPWWEQLHSPAGRWGYAWVCTCGAHSTVVNSQYEPALYARHIERVKKKHALDVKTRAGKRQHERAPYRLWRQSDGQYRSYPPPRNGGAVANPPQQARPLRAKKAVPGKDWLRENGPRWGKWDVTIHAWDPWSADPDSEYEYLFTMWQLNWFEARNAEKVLRATDRPNVVTREYSWR